MLCFERVLKDHAHRTTNEFLGALKTTSCERSSICCHLMDHSGRLKMVTICRVY